MASTANPKALTVKPKPTGIRRGVLYTEAGFLEAMGIGRRAYMVARRKGLPVRKLSCRNYIYGDEAIEWLKSQALTPA